MTSGIGYAVRCGEFTISFGNSSEGLNEDFNYHGYIQ